MNEKYELINRIKVVLINSLNADINAEEINSEESLFSNEIGLDSLGILNLVVGLEQEFNIEIEDEDFSYEAFTTVTSIAGLVSEILSKKNEKIIS